MPKYYEHSAPKRRKLERQLDLEDAHGELILNTKEYQHSRNDNFLSTPSTSQALLSSERNLLGGVGGASSEPQTSRDVINKINQRFKHRSKVIQNGTRRTTSAKDRLATLYLLASGKNYTEIRLITGLSYHSITCWDEYKKLKSEISTNPSRFMRKYENEHGNHEADTDTDTDNMDRYINAVLEFNKKTLAQLDSEFNWSHYNLDQNRRTIYLREQQAIISLRVRGMTMKEIVNITHISRGSILKWHINILYQESPYRFGLKKTTSVNESDVERLNLNEIKKLFKWPLGDIKSNRRSTSHIERRIIIRLISSGMKLKDAKEIVGITSGSICEWSEYKDGYKKNKNTYPPLCNVTDFCDEEKSVNIEWEDNIVNNYTLEELKEKYNWPEGEKNGSKRVYSADEKQGIIRLAVSKGWSVRDVSRVAGVSMGALYGWPEFKQRDTHKSRYKPIQTEVITDVDHALSEPAYIKTPKSSTSLHTISESKVNQELSGVTDTQENISSLDISGSNFNKVAGTQGGDIHPAINKLIIVVLDVLEKMAKDAAKELPDKTRKNQTTAMGLSYDGKLYLASSTKHLSLKQQAWAKRYRVKIKSGLPDERDSGYHAEERLIIYEPPMRFINPDRLICIDCEKAMKRNGVRFSVEGTKSKSKKRIVGIDLSTDNYASKLKSNSGINNGGHFKLLAPIDSPLNVLRNKVIFNVSYLGSLQELSNDERLKGWDRVFNWLKKHSFDQENLEDVMSVLAENGFIIPTEMYVAVLLRFRQLHVMESSLKPD